MSPHGSSVQPHFICLYRFTCVIKNQPEELNTSSGVIKMSQGKMSYDISVFFSFLLCINLSISLFKTVVQYQKRAF